MWERCIRLVNVFSIKTLAKGELRDGHFSDMGSSVIPPRPPSRSSSDGEYQTDVRLWIVRHREETFPSPSQNWIKPRVEVR